MPGHFARTGPVLVHLVPAGLVPVHFAPPGRLLGDYAPAGPLLGDFARNEKVFKLVGNNFFLFVACGLFMFLPSCQIR